MDKDISLLLQKAESGNPAAQYELAKRYGRMIQDAESDEDTYSYSKQAMMWLKKSAMQGYAPAKEALEELKKETLDFSADAAQASASSGRDGDGRTQARQDAPPSAETAARPAAEDRPRESSAAVKNTSFSSSGPAPSGGTVAPPVLPEMNPPLPDSFVDADAEEYDMETVHPAGPLSGPGGVIVVVLLIISLLANAVLVFLLCRSKAAEEKAPPSPPPPISDGINLPVIDDPEPAGNPGEEVNGEEVNGEENSEATAPADPVIEENEQPVTEEVIDLAQLRRLDFIPSEIYGEFVYYTVQTEGYDLNIRKGPGTNYDAIGSIPNGTQIGVAAENERWYLACYENTYGWVYGDYLRAQ